MSYFSLPSGAYARPSLCGVASIADLRASGPSANFANGMVAVVTGVSTFAFDAASTTADNGTTVIKPTDIPSGPGRWLAVSSGAGATGATGAAGATGATGGGGGVTGSGTSTRVAVWDGTNSLTDSGIIDDGSLLTTSYDFKIGGNVRAGEGSTPANQNTLFGTDVMLNGTNNVIAGYKAMEFNTGSASCVAVGRMALRGKNPGFGPIVEVVNNCVAIGYAAAATIQTGADYNVAVGYSAMIGITTGTNNVAVGSGAGFGLTSSAYNCAFGDAALSLGGAMAHDFTRNVAIGPQAMFNGFNNTNPSEDNIALGYQAAFLLDGSSRNVIIGKEAGQSFANADNNVFIGASSGGASFTGSNSVAIGYQAAPSTTSASNEITLGNASIATLRCQVTSITSLSDRRDKKDIEDLLLGLAFVQTLRPVKFTWAIRGQEAGHEDAGFIAQELGEAQTAAGAEWMRLVYDANPERLEANAGKLLPVLVKAIQELADEVAALRAKIK